MKKIIIPAIAAIIPTVMSAQSTVDAYTLSQNELRGTARFMSMGGAFTALGGDLSTLSQNPAGVAIYRGSEIGATLDIDARSFSTDYQKDTQTKVFCNNFGYVGTAEVGSGLKSISWGVTYGRVASFDRIMAGYNKPTNTSLTNYIAAFSGGQSTNDLGFDTGYNPYLQSDCDWLSILAYNSYLINEKNGSSNQYVGLFQNGTYGDAFYYVRERGHIDEYNFDLAGNVSDVVYWGIGIGATDLSYTRQVNYSEGMENARIYYQGSTVTGDAGFYLDNLKHITGSGWNFKLGVIVKPIQELRLGFAFHTPTYYTLHHGYDASVDYSYYNPNEPESNFNPKEGNEYTEWASFDSKIQTPWRMMVGAAAVIANSAIVSVDYERQAYDAMKVKYQYGYNDFADDVDVNKNIKNICQASNIVRVGIEYRVTPQFSLRAGYNAQTSNVKADVSEPKSNVEVLTSGTDTSFSLSDKVTQYLSFGLGYKYKGWYFDGAYVHKNTESTFRAYTNFNGIITPYSKVKENISSIVLSIGYKF